MIDQTGPVWLEKMNTRGGGVDHLGLRLPGLQMADALLPGITNTTRRARNYSLIAWMYYHAKDLQHLRALESAFIHAVRRHNHVNLLPSTGAVGNRSVPKENETGFLPLLTDEPIVSVLRADFYGPSARLLGLAGKDSMGRYSYEALARRLANAINVVPDKIPPDCKNLRPVDADTVAPLCLCQPPSTEERELLIEVFFRLNEPRTKIQGMEEQVDSPRRLSLALLLLSLEETDTPEAFLLQRFLDWALLTRVGWEPPEKLTEHAYGWAIQGMRWHFRHALETIWAGFGRLIDEYKFDSNNVKPYVEVVVQTSNSKSIWTPEPEKKVGRLTKIVPDITGIELEGHREMERWLDDDPAKAILIAATQLATMAERMVRLIDPDRYFNKFIYLGEPDRVSMAGFARRFDKDLTIREWLSHLIERYAIGQHFLTGARKWLTGIDGFFFHPTGEGYRLREDGFQWKPDPGKTKIWAAMHLLNDLSLVKEKNGCWAPTSDGHNLGNQCLKNM